MQIKRFQPKRTTRSGGLSLAGMGATLAINALPGDANAAVQLSAEPQSIAASGPSESGQRLTIPVDIDGDGNTEFDLVGYVDSNTSEVYVRLEPVEAGASVVGSQVFPFLADKVAGDASIEDPVVIRRILTCLDDNESSASTALLPDCRASPSLPVGLFD